MNGSSPDPIQPAREPDALARLQLTQALQRAQYAIAWERGWPALARLLCVIGLFLVVSWAGLWLALPFAGRAVGIAVFVLLALGAIFPLVLVGGLATFALAMWWDGTDLKRQTRRSDVAFWLHLAAAPMIAHPVFHMLGVFEGDIGAVQAVIVMALYVVFAIIALAIDRRALLVSSLAYVLYALSTLFNHAGAVELSMAFTALVIGSALLTPPAFWQPMRRSVVGMLGGGLASRLPPAQAAIA